jgi:hypothetical protein
LTDFVYELTAMKANAHVKATQGNCMSRQQTYPARVTEAGNQRLAMVLEKGGRYETPSWLAATIIL